MTEEQIDESKERVAKAYKYLEENNLVIYFGVEKVRLKSKDENEIIFVDKIKSGLSDTRYITKEENNEVEVQKTESESTE